MQAATRQDTTPRQTVPLDRQGLESLFETHNRKVFQAAYRITGNASDAEDVLQTVFLRLMRREGGPPLTGNLAGYLYTAAVNAALDLLRARGAARTAPLSDREETLPAPGSGSPERQSEGREAAGLLRRALTRLSPRAAQAFTLRYFEGYGNREIARMLDCSHTTIAVMLHRARAQLREEMGGLS